MSTLCLWLEDKSFDVEGGGLLGVSFNTGGGAINVLGLICSHAHVCEQCMGDNTGKHVSHQLIEKFSDFL